MKTLVSLFAALLLGVVPAKAGQHLPSSGTSYPRDTISSETDSTDAEMREILNRMDELRSQAALLNELMPASQDTTGDDENTKKIKELRASIRAMIVDVDKKIAKLDSIRASYAEKDETVSFSLFRGIKANFNERKIAWLQDIRDVLAGEDARLENITKGMSKIGDKISRTKVSLASKLKGLF